MHGLFGSSKLDWPCTLADIPKTKVDFFCLFCPHIGIAVQKSALSILFHFTWFRTAHQLLLFDYRIRTNRMPLLIGVPGYTFLAHCGSFLQQNGKSCCIFGQFPPKLTIVQGKKIIDFNRAPAFYLRGYGIKIEGF